MQKSLGFLENGLLESKCKEFIYKVEKSSIKCLTKVFNEKVSLRPIPFKSNFQVSNMNKSKSF